MKRIFLAALLTAGPAFADLVATEGADSLRLTTEKCAAAYISAEVRGDYRAASAVVGGQSFKACWTWLKNGAVLILYEDGAYGVLPLESFKNEPGV
jgi:hypothetical protein